MSYFKDEDVIEFEKAILETLRPMAAKLSGEKMPKKFTKKQRKEIKEAMNLFGNFGNILNQLENQTLPRDFKSKQQINYYDKMFGLLFGTQDNDPIKKITSGLNPKPFYDRISPSPQYAENMQRQIHQIFSKMAQKGVLAKFDIFLQSIGQDYFIANSQSAMRINENLEYLLKPRKRITKQIVEKYIVNYKEVSGFLEGLIAILYGIKLILDGKYRSFTELQNNAVANMVRVLKKEVLFKTLLNIYTPSIRNSVIHVNYQIDYLNKTIEFADRKGKVTLSFEEFVVYVQEVTRRAVIISQLEREYAYLRYLAYQKVREDVLNMKD